MPDHPGPDEEVPENEGDVMAGDRRIARTDTALPDWYVSDTAYRPIPIVWFAGALILQVILQSALYFVFAVVFGASPFVTIAAALLGSALIWHLAMRRGMASASFTWRCATLVMLAFFFLLTALSALA